MYRLSLIISEIYNKFLPLTEKGEVSLNLDFSDTTKEVSNPEEIRQALEQALDSAFQRTDRGDISITVNNSEIVITDQGTILSKTVCTLLSRGRVRVKSRVGFGTDVHITLETDAPVNDGKISSEDTAPTKLKAKIVIENTEKDNQPECNKSTKRAIDIAAKRADKKVQKIAEKAQKRLKRTSTKKKPKVIHKISFS